VIVGRTSPQATIIDRVTTVLTTTSRRPGATTGATTTSPNRTTTNAITIHKWTTKAKTDATHRRIIVRALSTVVSSIEKHKVCKKTILLMQRTQIKSKSSSNIYLISYR
jgi:hypothetical protein